MRDFRIIRILIWILVVVVMAHLSYGEAAAQVPEREVTLESGHADIGPRIVDGEWTLQAREDLDGQSTWWDIDEVEFAIGKSGELIVPEGDQFLFLGPPGKTIWVFPQVQQHDVLWPGWNSQDPSVTNTIDGNITWSLKSVDAAGDFFIFLSGSFGEPELLFGSTQDAPSTVSFELDTHAHGNWAFTDPGIYLLEMEMSARSISGESLSDTGVLRVVVGDTSDPTPEASPTALPQTVSPTSSVPTETVAPTVANDPPPSEPASTNTGALIAASVGGALVLGLILFVVTRRRRKNGGGAT